MRETYLTGKVLIVDDEPGVRDIVKSFVEHDGHTVLTAVDGVEALEFIKAENFDIVISDIQMPRMDGLTLTEEIRKIQPDTIVILMTGYASVNTAVEAIKKGVFDYILKPFQNLHIILHAIQLGLERKHLLHERKALVENLGRTNDELTYNRILLNDKIKKMDSELSRRVERLTTLFDISSSTSSITDLGDLLPKIVGSITQAMKDAACAIWLVDFESELLEKAATIGFKNDSSLPESFHINEGELGAAASTDLVRVFKGFDELSDPVLKKICLDEGISALIMVPLCYESKILGVVAVMYRHDYLIADDDVSLLKSIADQASVSVKNAELFASQQKIFRETIEALATAIDSRDHYTGGHSLMVTQYALTIAQRLELNEEQLDQIQTAGLLHDIGKIGIEDSILNKPGRLTEQEMGVIKAHPILGRTIVESINALKEVAMIIYYHHEHYDGSGYPECRRGEDIPLLSRILTVADVFHALASARIYRDAMPLEKAIAIMTDEMGTTFDPEIGRVFLDLVKEGEILPPPQQMVMPPGMEY